MMRAVARLLPLGVVLLLACERSAPPVRGGDHPDLRLEGVSIRSWSQDRLRVITTATRLDVTRELGTPGDVTAFDAGVLLVSDGTQLLAPVVTGNFFAGQFVGKGGVTMAGPGGLRASSPTVAFDRAQGNGGLATSDAGVELVQPGLRLEATGFSYDLGDQHARFEQPRTRFSPR